MCKRDIYLLLFRDRKLFFLKQFPLQLISGKKNDNQIGEKLLSDLVMFSRLSSDIPLYFHE